MESGYAKLTSVRFLEILKSNFGQIILSVSKWFRDCGVANLVGYENLNNLKLEDFFKDLQKRIRKI